MSTGTGLPVSVEAALAAASWEVGTSMRKGGEGVWLGVGVGEEEEEEGEEEEEEVPDAAAAGGEELPAAVAAAVAAAAAAPFRGLFLPLLPPDATLLLLLFSPPPTPAFPTTIALESPTLIQCIHPPRSTTTTAVVPLRAH